MISGSFTPESPPPRSTGTAWHACPELDALVRTPLSGRLCGGNPGRLPVASFLPFAAAKVRGDAVAATEARQPVARWSVGGACLETFANRDYQQMAATLSPDVRLRAVLPRLHLSWRVRVRPARSGMGDGWHVVELQADVDAGDTVGSLDLPCSGFHSEEGR